MIKRNTTRGGKMREMHEQPPPVPEIAFGTKDPYAHEPLNERYIRLTVAAFAGKAFEPTDLERTFRDTKIVIDKDMEVYTKGMGDLKRTKSRFNMIWSCEENPRLIHTDNITAYDPGTEGFKTFRIFDAISKNIILFFPQDAGIQSIAGASALSAIVQYGVPDSLPAGEYIVPGVCFDISGILSLPLVCIDTDIQGSRIVTYSCVRADEVVGSKKFLIERRALRP